MARNGWLVLSLAFFQVLIGVELSAQPVPGDVFREYTWYKQDGDAGAALRVGGRVGYEGVITLPHNFDLEQAIKAEVVIEKILCHDGTHGLAIQINDNDWLEIPEAQCIPYPQWDYQHHIYPVVQVPLSFLKTSANRFRMRVSPEHSWNWPQNLINGVHFRIYYDPAKKTHPVGKMTSPKSGDTIGRNVQLQADAQSPNGKIKQVDYVGRYEDVNFEGDGLYYQWHYHLFHGKIMHHLGSATAEPYQLMWDTSWAPDQKECVQIAARIIDETDLIYMTQVVSDLDLVRPGLSVELCKPYDVPKRWVTRAGRMQQRFDVTGDLDKAIAAQLVWASWSPGYMNGIYINGKKVFDQEGPRYQYYAHRVTLRQTDAFKRGINILETGETARIDGKMVHGMEVNWPGIMVIIQYKTETEVSVHGKTAFLSLRAKRSNLKLPKGRDCFGLKASQ